MRLQTGKLPIKPGDFTELSSYLHKLNLCQWQSEPLVLIFKYVLNDYLLAIERLVIYKMCVGSNLVSQGFMLRPHLHRWSENPSCG